MPLLTSQLKPNPELLPDKVPPELLFTKSIQNKVVWVLEHPPCPVTVTWKSVAYGWSGKYLGFRFDHFRVHKPWTYYLVRMNKFGGIEDSFLFFAKKKAKSDRETVYLPPLPNIYPSARICNGTIRSELGMDRIVRVRKLFEEFWTTPFTHEVWPEDPRLLPRGFRKIRYDQDDRPTLHTILDDWCRMGDRPISWSLFRIPHTRKFIRTLGQAVDYALFHQAYS